MPGIGLYYQLLRTARDRFMLQLLRTTKITLLLVIAMLIVANTVNTVNVNVLDASQAHRHIVEGLSIVKFLRNACPVYGGTLRIALAGEPNTLNWWVASSVWSLGVLSDIYDRLVRIINGTLVFELAKRIEWSTDYRVLTITIVKGVKFQDGKPLTAYDVAFTINTLSKYAWTILHGYFTNVEKVEVVDNYTIKIYFKRPDPAFIYNALTKMNIMPKHIWEPIFKSLGNKVIKYSPKISDLVGSGPFKIVKYVPEQYIELVANDNYWLKKPCIDKLIYIFIPEASTAVLALQKGEIDAYIGYMTPEVVKKLKSIPGVAVHLYISDTFFYWGFNDAKWPFNITEFRRALAYAVNKEIIVKDLLMGYGIPGNPGVVPPIGVNAKWCDKELFNMYKFNLTKTAEILDRLGFRDVDHDGWREAPNGKDFSIKIYVPSYDVIRVRVAELLSKWLSEIPGGGLKAIPVVLDWKTLWPMIKSGKAETFLLGSSPDTDISWLLRRFHSRPLGSSNWVRYSNPIIDNLTEELVTVFNPKERKEIAYKIQEIIAREVPLITLYYRKFPIPYRIDKWKGWFLTPSELPVNRITLLRIHLAETTNTTVASTITRSNTMSFNASMTTLQVIIAIAVLIAIVSVILTLVVKAGRKP